MTATKATGDVDPDAGASGEDIAAAEDEAAKTRDASKAAVDAESASAAAKQAQTLIDNQTAAREANDAKDGTFVGQANSSDHYSVSSSEDVYGQSVELKATGWVGPGFVIPANRVKEVAKLLGSIKNLPKAD